MLDLFFLCILVYSSDKFITPLLGHGYISFIFPYVMFFILLCLKAHIKKTKSMHS